MGSGYDEEGDYTGSGEYDADLNYVGPAPTQELLDSFGDWIGGYNESGGFDGVGEYDADGNYVGANPNTSDDTENTSDTSGEEDSYDESTESDQEYDSESDYSDEEEAITMKKDNSLMAKNREKSIKKQK